MKNINFRVLLDEDSRKKIKDYSNSKKVSISEVLRVLIEHTSNKIEVRSLGEVITTGQQVGGKEKNNVTMFTINLKQKEKIEALAKKYKTSFSEICRTLILTTDLDKYKYKTRREKTVNYNEDDIERIVNLVVERLEKRKNKHFFKL